VSEVELSAGLRRPSRAAALARPSVAVALLVAVSIVLRVWLGRAVPTPWIAPDEMIYALLGRTLYRTGRLAIEGAHSGYYTLLYPVLIGGPLAWASPARGYEVAKALGGVAMSLAAVPAYLWARTVVPPRSAVAVAALTLAIPAFALTGLLMTETLFYPVALTAAWAAARVLVEPTRGRQLTLVALVAAAALVRLQGVVLVLVFATAALLYAGPRDAVRRHRTALAGFAALVALWTAWRLARGGGAFGAYSVVASGGYHPGAVARYVVYHVGDLVLVTGLVPVAATAALWFQRRRLETDARAALAVATALAGWLVLQVGAFASRYVGHLAERDLIVAVPPLFLCLLVWLQRAPSETRRRRGAIAIVALACAFAWPATTLLAPAALPDNPTLIAISRLAGSTAARQQLLVDVALALLALLFVLAPRPVLRALPALLFALLAGSSILAARGTAAAARTTKAVLVGARPDWIDRAPGRGDAVLLYGGARDWPVVWETLFWNHRVVRALALPGAEVLGPVPGGPAWVAPNGAVSKAGRPVQAPYVVTSSSLQLAGRRIASSANGAGNTTVGTVLWNARAPLGLRSLQLGLQPNGDVYGSGTIQAYDCPGTLRATLRPKSAQRLNLYRDGRLYRSFTARPPDVLHLAVPSRPGASGRCSFGITSTGLLGTSGIAFVPDG
jgi:hypothetical protein